MHRDVISTVEFSTRDLRALPPEHMGFFVSSCIAVDEIALFQKLLLLTSNGAAIARKTEQPSIVRMAYSSTLIAQRNLSAKLVEYIGMIEAYSKQCHRRKTTTLASFRKKAVATASKAMNSPEYLTAVWYRNTITNHYLVSEITALIKNADLGEPDEGHPIFLHAKDGNSAYVLGEQILLAKLAEGGRDPIVTQRKLDNWVFKVAAEIMRTHTGLCIALMKEFFPDKVALRRSIDVDPRLVGSLDQSNVPVIWNFPENATSPPSRRDNNGKSKR